ncbi:MAG: DUF2071 domain-containing protein [Actinomycetota bacterium]|nr:DUF2071 domain-containing protein [Actinomycetota bacterium]
MEIPGIATTPPPLTGATLFGQRWQQLALLHWPVEPAAVARYFPAGTRPDQAGGLTYVGLVPFRMRGAGPGRLPVPYFGTFIEWNVRLYSVDDAGRHGLLFRSLETQRLLIAALTRAGLGLPYTWAAMSLWHEADEIRYRTGRRWPRAKEPITSRLRLRVGAPTEPTPLEVWLTARWGLHTSVAGRTVWIPNEHGPWPLHEAQVLDLDDGLVAAAGVVATGEMLRPLYSPGVRVRFGTPVRLRA